MSKNFTDSCRVRNLDLVALYYETDENDFKNGLEELAITRLPNTIPFSSQGSMYNLKAVREDNKYVLPVLEYILGRVNAESERMLGMDLKLIVEEACRYDLQRMKILLKINAATGLEFSEGTNFLYCAADSKAPLAAERIDYVLSLDWKIVAKDNNNRAFKAAVFHCNPETIEFFLKLKDVKAKNETEQDNRQQKVEDVVELLLDITDSPIYRVIHLEKLLPLLNKYGFFNTDEKLLNFRNLAQKEVENARESYKNSQREKAKYLLQYIKELITVSKLHKGITPEGKPILNADNATDISKFLFNIKPIEKII